MPTDDQEALVSALDHHPPTPESVSPLVSVDHAHVLFDAVSHLDVLISKGHRPWLAYNSDATDPKATKAGYRQLLDTAAQALTTIVENAFDAAPTGSGTATSVRRAVETLPWCPQCGEQALDVPPRVWLLSGWLPRPAHSHYDGTPLCPVSGPRGSQPAEPTTVGPAGDESDGAQTQP
jgi:hypothetical protein